ncbi:MAG: hypothetical protein ABR507_05885 [Actinomycetota bacterium]|nr:hypothetical protein [Actinomycetota bacterium]
MKRRLALLLAGIVSTTVFIGFAHADTIPAGEYYVSTDGGASVWHESNGLEGLQKDVTHVQDAADIPADTQVA